jgi:hypothetical protein
VREQRERDNFVGSAFSNGRRLGGKPTKRAMAVTRQRIMDSRVDPSPTQQTPNYVPSRDASDVQVICTSHAFDRSHQTYGGTVEKPAVLVDRGLAGSCPPVEVGKLRRENRRLNGIEAAISAHHHVRRVRGRSTMISEGADPGG